MFSGVTLSITESTINNQQNPICKDHNPATSESTEADYATRWLLVLGYML